MPYLSTGYTFNRLYVQYISLILAVSTHAFFDNRLMYFPQYSKSLIALKIYFLWTRKIG